MDLVPRFWDLMLEMFGTIFGQSRTVFKIGFGPENDVFGFCCVFWCLWLFKARNRDSMMNGTRMVHCREGSRGALFSGSEIWDHFLCRCLI